MRMNSDCIKGVKNKWHQEMRMNSDCIKGLVDGFLHGVTHGKTQHRISDNYA
uniref:Uncharacterized protein n=1 Tax=Anguilla anguilla TaxID=7936 RepID=A0A0E9XSM6_ANGAN